MTGSGYKNRTAWAGAGSGVLFIDLENSGTIKQANQIIFTKWDPTASSDMQALKHIFDTNHNGKLDTGDARFAAFKIMVTNADGTTTSKTLAQAGVASIDLTENENTRTFSDGSYISGTTTFARTAGGTGTAATVSLAFDPEGFVVRSTTVTNAGTGVVTLDNRAVDSDGSLASETISETSSDGRTQTIRTDLNGDGQIDRVQTNVSVVNESTTTLTRTDKTIFGALLDRIVTTTSVSGRVTTTTISRNANGAVASGNDVISQSEVDTTVNGLTTVKIDDLNFDGSKWHETVTTPSNGGLTSTIEDDIDGNGVFDLTTVTATTVTASTGLRTTTTEDRNSDGSLRDRTVRTASASGLSQTTVSDADGDGLVDLSTSSTIVAGTTSSFATGRTGTTTTTVATSRDGTFLNETKSFVSDDGLAKVTQVDLNGAGTATAPVFTSTTVDVTTIDAATSARTQTVTVKSANGALQEQTVTVKAVDGISRTIRTDSTGTTSGGAPVYDQIETVAVAASQSNAIVDTLTTLTMGGTQVSQDVTTTSADGLISSVTHNIDGKVDLKTTSTTVVPTSGGSTVTVVNQANDSSVIDTTTTATSANGLVVTTQTDVGGMSTISTDTKKVKSNGDVTDTLLVKSSNGTLERQIYTAVSSDRRSKEIWTDANGNGLWDRVERASKNAAGILTETLSTYLPDGTATTLGTLKTQTVTTTNATGLSRTVTSNIDGKVDSRTTDVTVLNANGSRTETVTGFANNGAQTGQTITTTSANGLFTTTTTNRDGHIDYTDTDTIVLDAKGGRSEVIERKDASGAVIISTQTTTSADGLSKTTQISESPAGVAETVAVTRTDVTTINADGSTTNLVTSVNTPSGTLRDRKTTSSSANGLSVSMTEDSNGDGFTDQTSSTVTQLDGKVVETLKDINPNGTTKSQTSTTTSANGLSVIEQIDVDGNGSFDEGTSDVTTINADGSRSTTTTHVNGTMPTLGAVTGATIFNSETVLTSADGRTQTTTHRVGSVLQDTVVSTTAHNPDGSTVETETKTSADAALRARTVETTSADGFSKTIQSNVFGPTPTSETEMISIQSNGDSIDMTTDFDGAGTKVAQSTVRSSANGLSTTTDLDQNGDGSIDETQTERTVIGVDGSRTTTSTDTNIGGLNMLTGFAENSTVVTKISANGLSRSATTTGSNGPDSLAHDMVQTTIINPDGSTTRTTTETVGAASDVEVITTERRGLSVTTKLSTLGTGTFDRTTIHVTNLDNSTVDSTVNLNANGSDGEVITGTTSADGRTKSVTDNTFENGFETYRTGSTTINSDGSTTDSALNYSSPGVLISKITNRNSANGLSTNTTIDTDGDGIIDETRSVTTVLNANGNRTKTTTDFDGGGNRIHQLVETTPASGLNATTTTAGSGAVLKTATVYLVYNPDGTTTETTASTSAAGVLLSKTTVATSADGRTVTTIWDLDGDGKRNVKELKQIDASGAETRTDTFYNPDLTEFSTTVKTMTADGRITQYAFYNAANPSQNTKEMTMVSADGTGSYFWDQKDSTGTTINRATHLIDGNGIDHIRLTLGGTQSNTTISVEQEAVDLDRVRSIYRVLLGRDLSNEEREASVRFITSAGLDVNGLAGYLIATPAFERFYGPQTTVKDFVNILYQNAFDRSPTWGTELQNQVNQLESTSLNKGGLASRLSLIADPGPSSFVIPLAQSGGAPNEITAINSSAGTWTDSFYDPATGQLRRQAEFTTGTNIQKSAVLYNELGQMINRLTFSAAGVELQSSQFDPTNGKITDAELFNTGGITSFSSVRAIVYTGASATVTGNNNSFQDNSIGLLTANGSNNTFRSPGGSNISIGPGSTGDQFLANNSNISAASGDSFSVTGNGDIVTANNATITVGAGVTITIRGNGNKVTSAAGSTIKISGTNTSVNGTNDTIIFGGDHAGDTVTGTGNSVSYVGGAFGLTGRSAISKLTSIIAEEKLASGDVIGAAAADAALASAKLAANGQSSVEGAIWTDTTVTWSLADVDSVDAAAFSGYLSAADIPAVRDAFSAWSRSSGLAFQQVEDGSAADIRIGYGKFMTSTTGIAGYTSYTASNGQMQPGTVIRLEDPSETRRSGQAQTYSGTHVQFEQLLMHEIGHALGLGDSSDPSSVMYYQSNLRNRILSAGDASAIKALYPASLSTRGDMLSEGQDHHRSSTNLNDMIELLGPSTGDLLSGAFGSEQDPSAARMSSSSHFDPLWFHAPAASEHAVENARQAGFVTAAGTASALSLSRTQDQGQSSSLMAFA